MTVRPRSVSLSRHLGEFRGKNRDSNAVGPDESAYVERLGRVRAATAVVVIGTFAALVGCAGPVSKDSSPPPAPVAVQTAPAPAAAPAPVAAAPSPAPSPPARAPGVRAPYRFADAFKALDLPAPNEYRAADGSPGPSYWQQKVNYHIDATLDAEAKTVTGRATVEYLNYSRQELGFLWIHLEQNLFKDDSLGSLASLPGARFSNRAGFEGGVKISYIRAAGEDLKYSVYDTLARIDLPKPVPSASGETPGRFEFEIAWSFRIPDYGVDRMGIEPAEAGPVFEIAQWFPAVAVFDDVHGWNTLPYLGQGEFYTNFGDFDVRLTVPRSHLVAATGVLQNASEVLTAPELERLEKARHTSETVTIRSEEEVRDPASRPAGEGALTWHFMAQNVRTFAWASSSAFIWDAAAVGGGGGEGPQTLAQSMYPKEGLPTWGKSTDMLRFAIERYGTRWFRYPYPVATNIFGNVGGMEYPMIIFCGASRSDRGLYGVTCHEIGHNWFPMTVNSDERRHAWMDEGFNTFINIYSEADRFEDGKVRRPGRRSARLLRGGLPPMDIPADQLGPGMLGTLEYEKTGEALYLLREVVLGPERFDRAFREYIRRWAFKSPQPADFFRTMENVAGADLEWFWRGWITESRTFDQAVEAVEQRSDAETATITFHNVGDMVMPVLYRVTYEDGATADRMLPVEVWYWTDEWKAEIATGGKKVVRVQVDPEGIMPERNRGDNEWKAPPPPEPATAPEPGTAGAADHAAPAANGGAPLK